MSGPHTAKVITDALLDFLHTGHYPEADNIATSELPEDLTTLLHGVSEAESVIKNETESLSSASAPELDNWIAQATAVQAAIAHSRETARSIVQEATAGEALARDVDDASAKVKLLRRELSLSVTLEGVLDTIQIVVGLNDASANALKEGEFSDTLDKLLQAGKVLLKLRHDEGGVGDCRAIHLLERRTNAVRALVVDEILEAWRTLVVADSGHRSIAVLQDDGQVPMSLEAVVDAMSTLGLLDTATTRLYRELEALIIRPRLASARRGATHRIDITAKGIQLSQAASNVNVIDTIQDVIKITDFISGTFPFALSQQLLNQTVPSLLLQLVSGWLDPSLSLSLEDATSFNNVVEEVSKLADQISQFDVEIPSEANLTNWLKKIPQSWLARRKEAYLSAMRASCYESVKREKTVERVETQIVQADDVMYGGQNQEKSKEWEEDWGDDGDAAEVGKQDEDDASAWEDSGAINNTKDENEIQDEVDAEGWGWEEEEITSLAVPDSKQKIKVQQAAAVQQNTANGATREITLRETYTITEVPETILSIIRQVLADASILASEGCTLHTIKPAGKALGTLPTLLLAMYRATANTLYNEHAAGQMLIYNDAVYLSEQLSTVVPALPPQHPLVDRLRSLETDLTLLLQFSRRAYGHEMDSQRTILSDILSSTSGFVNCTAPLNTKQYAATMQDVVKRVRDMSETWRQILSDSVRLQSLGSLTGTLVKQMISDILERADDPSGISDDQSKVLKSYCDKVAELSDLFQKHETEATEGQATSLVYIYTPGWFRFKYLAEILVASLADIRYLWTEGELKLEFRAEEVVDLIQALFADSSHRRDAIRDIKKITRDG